MKFGNIIGFSIGFRDVNFHQISGIHRNNLLLIHFTHCRFGPRLVVSTVFETAQITTVQSVSNYFMFVRMISQLKLAKAEPSLER